MKRHRILVKASHSKVGRESSRGRNDTEALLARSEEFADELGRQMIEAGFDILLSGGRSIDAIVGKAATDACKNMNVDPRERIKTYLIGKSDIDTIGMGMVLKPVDRRWQEIRTAVVEECDAVITVTGGKGTSDVIQKANLAGKLVFPIAVSGGASRTEWERLKNVGYSLKDTGDIDFLADSGANPSEIVEKIVSKCRALLDHTSKVYSRRVFVVHGHDGELKAELARFLEKLDFTPVIFHEQPDKGQSIYSKLHGELSDVGYAFVLLTPDDVASRVSSREDTSHRARQNVIFEFGLLAGILGLERVCAIVKGDIEIPSDLSGTLYKYIDKDSSIDTISFELTKELKGAGYPLDANRL